MERGLWEGVTYGTMTSQLTGHDSETLSWSRTLLPIAPSVPEARERVRQALGEWDLDHLKWRTDLLVTELVANAIKHAHTGGAHVTVLVMSGGTRSGSRFAIGTWTTSLYGGGPVPVTRTGTDC
ncbi:ATP-binding protein [Spongiactinospora gelatinilytica]|uniref:ATP-binding protein n=1 Tax=Spongiactinospora gelatinilytica TaxID=2666298 RepID=UPI0011B944FF|nr:ATP-binding protein [Spongiactinospora gelatinilytica]